MGELTVRAPDPSFEGSVAGIAFVKGAAKVDPKDNPGAYGYFQSAGYEISGKTLNDAPGQYARGREPEGAAPGTPDNPDGIERGAAPRDAAVVKDAAGPMSDAFMPPTNAGEADPHGPRVVSPGLHAVPPAPIRPGEVHVDDVARQEAEETKLAERVLVEGEEATVVDEPFDARPESGNMGPLGLSDPGSVRMGLEAAKDVRDAEDPDAAAARKSLGEMQDGVEATARPATRSRRASRSRARRES